MTLTQPQKETLLILRNYPKETISNYGWLSGNKGIRFKINVIAALKKKGMIDREGRITTLGKTCKL